MEARPRAEPPPRMEPRPRQEPRYREPEPDYETQPEYYPPEEEYQEPSRDYRRREYREPQQGSNSMLLMVLGLIAIACLGIGIYILVTGGF